MMKIWGLMHKEIFLLKKIIYNDIYIMVFIFYDISKLLKLISESLMKLDEFCFQSKYMKW